MTHSPVSVIVVSRHRAQALMRSILSLSQQDHPNFEVIVVADPEAIAQIGASRLPLKLITFDDANISSARNAGLAVAAAPVVAFMDDDAVAEPTWLSRLTGPFIDLGISSATGFVRGRNGVSYQWMACEVDSYGQDHPLDIKGTTICHGTALRAVKTQGTNCAFRRDVLLGLGGFDLAYKFYLDEADVNLRMASLGATAIVPNAEVHHGYQSSARRAANRVPLSLHEIAASTAVFLRRHAPNSDLDTALKGLSLRESKRISEHRRAGRIDANAEAALLTSLTMGWFDGLHRALGTIPPLPTPIAPFQPLNTGPKPGKILAGRWWQKRRLIAEAAALKTHIVTVICLSPTARPHKIAFRQDGIWLQTGGIFGRTDRQDPRIRLLTFRARIAEEVARLARCRPVK